jgi:hypothetical protein
MRNLREATWLGSVDNIIVTFSSFNSLSKSYISSKETPHLSMQWVAHPSFEDPATVLPASQTFGLLVKREPENYNICLAKQHFLA